MQEWYNVTLKEMYALVGGHGLLSANSYSLENLLRTTYPNHNWQSWRFTSPRSNPESATQSDKSEVVEFANQLKKQLGIRAPEDWYHVSLGQLKAIKCLTQLKKFGGLYVVLQTTYADHTWDASRLLLKPTTGVAS
jgi:hypothetical protein